MHYSKAKVRITFKYFPMINSNLCNRSTVKVNRPKQATGGLAKHLTKTCNHNILILIFLTTKYTSLHYKNISNKCNTCVYYTNMTIHDILASFICSTKTVRCDRW